MNKKRSLTLWMLIIIIIIGFIMMGILRQRTKGAVSSGGELATTAYEVVVASVTRSDIPVIERVTGVIEADPQVKVFPRASGRIERIKCHAGDTVKKKQVLVLIDRDVPGMDYSLHQVESPIKGTILEVYGEVGTQVAPNTPVVQVGNLDKLKLVAYVGEKQMIGIKKNQTCHVTVDSYPLKKFTGKVQTVSKILEAPAHKARVEISIGSQQEFLTPGMIARAEAIVAVHRNVLIVPKKAILEGDKGKYVVRVVENRTQFVPVKTGPTYQGLTELTSGVKYGDVVIVVGAWGIPDGVEVKPTWQGRKNEK